MNCGNCHQSMIQEPAYIRILSRSVTQSQNYLRNVKGGLVVSYDNRWPYAICFTINTSLFIISPVPRNNNGPAWLLLTNKNSKACMMGNLQSTTILIGLMKNSDIYSEWRQQYTCVQASEEAIKWQLFSVRYIWWKMFKKPNPFTHLSINILVVATYISYR